MDGVTLRPMTASDRADYEQIYLEAFPESERKVFSFMTEGERAASYELLTISTPTDTVAGLVILVFSGGLVMLDYFAVAPRLRGSGIGHAVLPLISAHVAEKHPGSAFFLEIETPCGDCPNPLQRIRRKAFYLSAGLTETGVHAFIYGSDMELLAFPSDAGRVTFEGYRALLASVFPTGMLPEPLS